MDETRPDPDKLLEAAKSAESAATRGKLKVYLGMAAGVGKTYAMLSDAIGLMHSGIDIIAGYIEPHGRAETESLATQLPRLEPKQLEYRGIKLIEFDLDAALKRHSQIILIDELAHTNAGGSRHLKRWQDVEELLADGISVWTTVNVQHIESLRDVVAGITGVEVRESVPDVFLEHANEIELVDIPPDELLQRVKEGKIYASSKIDTALQGFFQKNHLIALREIVLRHAANTVNAQLRSLRNAAGSTEIVPSSARVLVSIGPNRFALRLVRAAARLAKNLQGTFVAVSVETPHSQTLETRERLYVDKAFQLAERLGGETIRLSGHDIVAEVVRTARDQNTTIIVAGKPIRTRLRDYLFGSVVDDLIRRSGGIAVHIVQGSDTEGSPWRILPRARNASPRSMLTTLLIISVATCLSFVAGQYFELSNLIMIYLLAVAIVASRYGRVESITASVTSVLAFDFFFVPPRLTFAVSDVQYVVTFIVMLVIGILISTLTLRAKAQSEATAERERRTARLLSYSRSLTECRTVQKAAQVTKTGIDHALGAHSVLFMPTEDGFLSALNESPSGLGNDQSEVAVARWVAEFGREAGHGTDTLPGAQALYLPVELPNKTYGVLAVSGLDEKTDTAKRDLVDGFIHLLSAALDRIQAENDATESRLKAEQQELRNVLLSSVSHDLRTPLTAIAGSVGLLQQERGLSTSAKELLSNTKESVDRLSLIVRNVLDLTKLETGEVILNRDWNSIEEIVGSALRRTEKVLAPRKTVIEIPSDLPILSVDALLIEQLLVNLLENVSRHTPPETAVTIRASVKQEFMLLEVIDDGPGFKLGQEERIFDKLVRGETSQGFGLGLAVCRAIVKVHGGKISASHNHPHGAYFIVELPCMETSPEVQYG